MPDGAGGILVMLMSFVVTFLLARTLGVGWREKRKRKADAAAREEALRNESRQARRQRERRESGK